MGFVADQFVARLRVSGELLASALRTVDPRTVGRRPAPDRWSMLEIAAHLLDEERHDFGVRLLSTLEDPARPWSPIDPEAWVTARDYASWDYIETVDAFAAERLTSIEWLKDLGEVDWASSHAHPKLGEISAGDLLVGWVAHDLLHLSQLARTRADLLDGEAVPYSAHYAKP